MLTLVLLAVYGCSATLVPDKSGRAAASWQPVGEIWQQARLGDNRVGQRHVQYFFDDEGRSTDETLLLIFSQPGSVDRRNEIRMRYIETRHGEPLSVEKRIIGNEVSRVQTATLVGQRLRVESDNTLIRYVDVPENFLLREGVRQALLAGQGKTRQLQYSSWNFSQLAFTNVKLQASEVTADDDLAAIVDSNAAWLAAALAPLSPDVRWVILRTTGNESDEGAIILADDNFYPLAEFSRSGGDLFSLVQCDRECAEQDFSPVTHVYRQLIRSPYRISDQALAGKIRYTLEGRVALDIPRTGEQLVAVKDDGWEITVCSNCGHEDAPSVAELAGALTPNYWLPSEHAEIRAVVESVLPQRALSADAVMTQLTHFVSRHMNDVANYSGYATALEALRTGEGDCTEHALLLAAMGRAAGIPTRVVTGLVYNNDRFLGRRFVFVPHAWVQAWVGDHWQSFDSGLGDFSAGYIALALSDGEQAVTLGVNEKLHRLTIRSAVQIKSR